MMAAPLPVIRSAGAASSLTRSASITKSQPPAPCPPGLGPVEFYLAVNFPQGLGAALCLPVPSVPPPRPFRKARLPPSCKKFQPACRPHQCDGSTSQLCFLFIPFVSIGCKNVQNGIGGTGFFFINKRLTKGLGHLGNSFVGSVDAQEGVVHRFHDLLDFRGGGLLRLFPLDKLYR